MRLACGSLSWTGLFLALVLLSVGCASQSYPLNIEPDQDATSGLATVQARVHADLPPATTWDEEVRGARALLGVVLPKVLADSTTEESAELVEFRRELAEELDEGEVLAFTFPTEMEGARAFHELSVGLIEHPFEEVTKALDPGRMWGRYLDDYIGGAYVEDLTDERGRVVMARERMVLGTPWWAVGAGEMDMSKVEQVVYEADSTTVLWEVTASENGSVHLDVGYVEFRRYVRGDSERTLVVFNSVHRTEAGWFGDLLVDEGREDITRMVLGDMFAAHIEAYRDVADELLGE